uniref:Uncharacterized protein n=1 Tax=Bionectria ochroleuca TaxID=29856 RepID=A0A8H7NCB9_BIOOC
MYPNHFYSFWAWTIFNLASFVTAFGTALYHGHEAIRFLGVKNTLLFSQVVVAFVCNGRKRVDVTCAYVLAYSLVYPCSVCCLQFRGGENTQEEAQPDFLCKLVCCFVV